MGTSRLSVELKPLEDRDARAPAIARRIMEKSTALPGMTLYLQPVQDLTIEDRISRTQYQFSIEALDRDQLDHWLPRIVNALSQRPELEMVTSDYQNPGRMNSRERPSSVCWPIASARGERSTPSSCSM